MGQTYEIGQKLRVIANGSAHGAPIGKVVTVANLNPNPWGNGLPGLLTVEHPNRWFYYTDVKLAAWTKEELADELKKQRAAAYLTQCKLDYLASQNKDKYEDDEEFRKYQVRKIIANENVSLEDRAERVEALFNNI